MGKSEIMCPHCGSEKFQIHTNNDGTLKNVKGGKSLPLLSVFEETEYDHAWLDEDNSAGRLVECKCGDIFFIVFDESIQSYRINVDEVAESSAMLYCENCREGSLTKSVVCPNCKNRRVML